jgi:DNA-binding GntR family transcriptional regulator
MKDVIEYKPLTQSVFERLRSEILHGKLKPGEVLRQEEITARFGVSRTPVREAIQRLQMEGLITLFPRRKAVVAAFPLRKIREIYDVRARMEAFAAELAVERLTEKQLNKLADLIRQMEALDPETQLEKILTKNRDFHYIIYSAAGNETLVSMIDQLWRDILRLRSQYLLSPHGHIDSTREHRKILEALCAQDSRLVYDLVQRHCEHSKVTLLDGNSWTTAGDGPDMLEALEPR